MANQLQGLPAVDQTLCEGSPEAVPSVATQDKTENLDRSQPEATEWSDSKSSTSQPPVLQAPMSQATASQSPTSQHDQTLLPPEEGATTAPLSSSSPSALDQTLPPSLQQPATEQDLQPTTGLSSEGPTQAASVQQAPTRPAAAPHPGKGEPSPVAGYAILKELGRGGMGVVYKAKQPGLNRLVALKMILSGKGSKKERDLFKLEAEVIAKLQHPNIVQIYEIGEHNEAMYFSLEFVEGGCLADVMAKKLPTPHEAARIVQALAEGMDAAHSQGIVHRDLKPANVLLGGKPGTTLDEMVPKITDFGLAKLVEEGDGKKHQTGGIMGTPSYMPPEQAEGRNHQVGPPADIYSLGAVLYDLLAGKPPFRGNSLIETLQMVCNAKPRPPAEFNPAIPRDLQIICLKCLEKEPANRYRSARELAGDLRAFLEGAPISARSYTKWELTSKWVRRRPTAAALLGVSVLALLLLAFGGVFIARQQTALAREEEQRRADAEEHARVEKVLRENEEKEHARAEANFKEAGKAVNALTEVGHRRLSAVPHLESVRRELLEKALAFNERFLVLNGDRPGQRQEVGRAQLRVGEIQEMLGRQKPAEQAYKKAITAFAALVEESPGNPDYRRDLAKTWNDLAILQTAMSQHDAAEKSFTDALAIKSKLADESPASAEHKRELASSHTSRGHLRLVSKKPQEAGKDYEEALRLLSGLPRDLADEAVARNQSSLAALWTEKQPAKAAAEYEKAISRWKALSATSSEPHYRHELATAHANRGTLVHLQAKRKEAEADYESAAGLLARLTTEFKGVTAYRELLANVYHNHGQLLRDQARHREAEKLWRAELPLVRRLLDDLGDQAAHRQRLGQILNELGIALASTSRFSEVEGLWQEAIPIQEKLVAEHPRQAKYWQDLVDSCKNLATVLKALSQPQKLEKTQRTLVGVMERRGKAFPRIPAYEKELGQTRYFLAATLVGLNKLEESVQVLLQAAGDGFRDAKALATQTEWKPLREREDFQKLLKPE